MKKILIITLLFSTNTIFAKGFMCPTTNQITYENNNIFTATVMDGENSLTFFGGYKNSDGKPFSSFSSFAPEAALVRAYSKKTIRKKFSEVDYITCEYDDSNSGGSSSVILESKNPTPLYINTQVNRFGYLWNYIEKYYFCTLPKQCPFSFQGPQPNQNQPLINPN